jgi:hypothetical protein
MAHDLGKRLLPAFRHSLTGLPWARVNLRHGLGRTENMETCTAAAGSLLLEFATLSRLTGDTIFEVRVSWLEISESPTRSIVQEVARKALFALWNRRSPLSLMGNTINVVSRMWSIDLHLLTVVEISQQTGVRSMMMPQSSVGLLTSICSGLDLAYIIGGRRHRLLLRVSGKSVHPPGR